ncbi:MAG TPA: UvrD-helicase domain-containing protein [Gemmatimonadaceae bacterium]|nr:UvrD-helicase domain-containing protein [Gemmatimonadaceae bacterium]
MSQTTALSGEESMHTLPAAAHAATLERTPSPSQRAAIEAPPGALLVLAGPGAGKTFCLTERIRFLIERHGVDPARICAFTFTNKAAEEIAHRLAERLGDAAGRMTSGTIHAFCAALLRAHGPLVGLEHGFGIADEDYQLGVLRRIEGPRHWHRSCLTRFSAYRFRGEALHPNDAALFARYEQFLARRRLVDFDTLVLRTAELLEKTEESAEIRRRWDAILVDEFQDLNPVQYRIVRALARDHGHVFAVGDHEQSIYSWAGADRGVFMSFVNDFGLDTRLQLEDNRRCPRNVFDHARTLVENNEPIFKDRIAARAHRESPFPVRAIGFDTEDDEAAWVIADVCHDREAHGHRWGEVALLYRKHEIGERLETAFINAGVPVRLAQGRALGDDPVVGYVLAAARVIAKPDDAVYRDAFFRVVLPRPLYDEARAQAEAGRIDLRRQLDRMAAHLPRNDSSAKKIKRALYDWRNLGSLAKQQSLASLVQELLSRRVGVLRSTLEERHDEIADPASLPDVVQLASRLRLARDRRAKVALPPLGGAEIPITGMLAAIGIQADRANLAPSSRSERLDSADVPTVGLALGVFKAAQLLEMSDAATAFTDFTAVDLETTDKDINTAEIIDIAAVRVRNGRIVDRFSSFVRPRVAVSAGAAAVHGITDAELTGAPYFETVWPKFRDFCGGDVIVAHNGYQFDFPILARMVRSIGATYDLSTYDTLPLARDLFPTSRKLGDLARQFGIDVGQAHRALDDSVVLAGVFTELDRVKLSRARKTALVNLLDHLGVALALSAGVAPPAEVELFRNLTRPFALGRYSHCLEWYDKERAGDASLPTVDDVIDRLGGRKLMMKIRAEKTADERYPSAMARLRRLIAEIPDSPLREQLPLFLERAVLSKWDGLEPDRERVNLLTLHSTKGLEFSRVYIVGAEDGQLPGGSQTREPSQEELEEARRLLYVGMTRTIDRLILTRAATRGGKPTGGHRFLDDMDLALAPPS